uniref:Uncharacterized protein n=1 Tax=Marmota marmota marmota TaxID=9994 RepID=A0A8C5ZEJ6_MARMA
IFEQALSCISLIRGHIRQYRDSVSLCCTGWPHTPDLKGSSHFLLPTRPHLKMTECGPSHLESSH